MLRCRVISAFATATLVGAFTFGPAPPAAELSRAALHRVPDLGIHARPVSGDGPIAVPARAPGEAATPACIGEVCQPRVTVPGFELGYARPSRTELAVVYLERADLEPFATVGWLLLATGLRFDYVPPVFDEASQAPARWGSVFVRVKFRIDADNKPVIPRRHR